MAGRQTIPLANGARVELNARAHYQSKTLTSLEFLPEQFQGSYWIVDAQATYRSADGRWSAGAYVNNLFDEAVIGQTFLLTYAATHPSWAILRPPRTYGVRLGFNF